MIGFPFWIPSDELLVGDELVIAGMVVCVNRIDDSQSDTRTIHATICDDAPSRSLMTFTIPKSAQVAIVK